MLLQRNNWRTTASLYNYYSQVYINRTYNNTSCYSLTYSLTWNSSVAATHSSTRLPSTVAATQSSTRLPSTVAATHSSTRLPSNVSIASLMQVTVRSMSSLVLCRPNERRSVPAPYSGGTCMAANTILILSESE